MFRCWLKTFFVGGDYRAIDESYQHRFFCGGHCHRQFKKTNKSYDKKGVKKMSDVPVQLVVAAFQEEDAANAALKELKALKKEKLIGIQNAAVIRKDAKGKIHIKETADMGGGKGSVIGGVAGAAIGLIAGPALVVPAAVGALVGGLAAKLRDSGFSDQRLKTLGEGLQPGTSAIVAVVEHKWVEQLEAAMAEVGADLVTANLQADIAAQLEAGHDVAYTALATQEGLVAARQAGGEDEVEGGAVVVTDDAVYGGRYVATPDGFAVEQFAATEEGVAYEAAAGVMDEADEEGGEEAEKKD
jgi:uncharacterized membrane protein